MMNVEGLKEKAARNRLQVLKTVMKTKKGHLGGTYSCIDLLTALYYNHMHYDINHPDAPNRDRLIIGKGHACLGVYNILIDLGFIDPKLLDAYGSNGSYLGAQLDMKIPGVETNTGSLGHAIGIACGLAIAAKLDKRDYKTYALVGDGECDEGSIWESVMFAGQNQIQNLIAIVDRNWQSVTEIINKEDEISSLESRFEASGWNVVTIDGHDFDDILSALETRVDGPLVIVADTVKGKGVSFMESGVKWHHSVPSEKEYAQALKELTEASHYA
tara:strand:+ start:56 stop:874 length:819 start_codon:yes stop_codon:yes gene_type:complete